ncbi:MAG: glycosyltransferase [Actinomycetales bacterium]
MNNPPASPEPKAPNGTLLAIVGTDHHPFDRLVGWMQEWADEHPHVHVIVQYGSSTALRHDSPVDGRKMLTRGELDDLLLAADVIVAHGGPATISEIRARGLVPIVVPRDPDLGEHVDGHQQRFARRMGEVDFVKTRETRSALFDTVNRALDNPEWLRLDTTAERARRQSAIAATTAIFDELMAHPRRLRARRR